MNARPVLLQALAALASLGIAGIVWADAAGAQPSKASPSISSHAPWRYTSFSIEAGVPLTTTTPLATSTGTSTPGATATPCTMPFSDVSPSDYFYEAVGWLYCHGAISGYADGTFRPYNYVTRGQICKIVVLALNVPL